MKVVALAGGVGAGKFLRGLARLVEPDDLTVVVNTGDDISVHGLHVSPDLDSVVYWLAGVADRDRGWGRKDESFRATEQLRAFDAEGSWFGLGDLDLATHLFRTPLLASGWTLSEVTDALARRFGLGMRIRPMSDDTVTTRVEVVDEGGVSRELHFQEYWVLRGARDEVKSVRFEGAGRARPAPGVLDALEGAEAILLCPSNPVASIDPILAIPGMRGALAARPDRVAGVSPIVAGSPLRGMADRLLPAVGVETTAVGVAQHYDGILGGWVIDWKDAHLVQRVRGLGLRAVATDTIMSDDAAAEALAAVALEVATSG